jgi:hypothetical protein
MVAHQLERQRRISVNVISYLSLLIKYATSMKTGFSPCGKEDRLQPVRQGAGLWLLSVPAFVSNAASPRPVSPFSEFFLQTILCF